MPVAATALAALSAPPALAFLEGIGAMEMMLVAVIGLLLFGGKGLPDMARTVGKVVREFKKASANVEEEVKRVMNEEPAPAPKPKPRPRPVTPAPSSPASPAALPPSSPSAQSTPLAPPATDAPPTPDRPATPPPPESFRS